MKNTKVMLVPLTDDDREQFILDNQESFRYGATEEFGLRDDHIEEDGEIISRKTIERSINAPNSEAYRIMLDGKPVGGVVLQIDNLTNHNHLDLLFVSPKNTARISDFPHGRRSRLCIRKRKFGKPAHRILKSGTFIFTSTNADFML